MKKGRKRKVRIKGRHILAETKINGVFMFELVGIIGMVLIVLAWIPQTVRTIRTKKVGIEPKFLWLYLFGCIGLVIYSIYISDPIFIGLNSISLILSSVNIYYHYKYGRVLNSPKGKQKSKR